MILYVIYFLVSSVCVVAMENEPISSLYVSSTENRAAQQTYVCTDPQCDKSFTRLASLKNHLRAHSEIKSHSCTHPGCNRAFTRRGALNNHLRTHTNQRPFQCTYPMCHKNFKQLNNLKAHIKIHTAYERYMDKKKDIPQPIAHEAFPLESSERIESDEDDVEEFINNVFVWAK